MHHNQTEETDAAKLVKLTSRDVADAQRLLGLLATDLPTAQTSEQDRLSSQTLHRRARDLVSRRARRYQFFSRAMFGEAAWDMLLHLYVLGSGARQTVRGLADLAGAPKSSALRWVEYLEHQQLLTRVEHPTDARACLVQLTGKATEILELYLSEADASTD